MRVLTSLSTLHECRAFSSSFAHHLSVIFILPKTPFLLSDFRSVHRCFNLDFVPRGSFLVVHWLGVSSRSDVVSIRLDCVEARNPVNLMFVEKLPPFSIVQSSQFKRLQHNDFDVAPSVLKDGVFDDSTI